MNSAEASPFQEHLKVLNKAPRTFECPEVQVMGKDALWYESVVNTRDLRARDAGSRVKTLYYEGMPYKGKPTRIFAFMGMPRVPKGEKVPGIVLVHGGGGTAFEAWVRLWNARGYATIAIDTCGCLPIGSYGNWQRSPYGGPAGWGGFGQLDDAITDQWPFHAVSAVVLANSLLRSQPNVDPKRIGLTGISWGGYLTCISAGVDNRFTFAVPVYGCGFLGDNSVWAPEFEKMGKDKSSQWLGLWDPSVYLPNARMPMLWITGTNDFAYPMDSLRKSYRLPKGPRTLCITVNMAHGHGGPGEVSEEIHAFADSTCMGGVPLPKITSQGRDGNTVWAKFSSKTKVGSAKLVFTKQTGFPVSAIWESTPAQVEGAKARGPVFDDVTAVFLNLTDDRGLVVSTEYVER